MMFPLRSALVVGIALAPCLPIAAQTPAPQTPANRTRPAGQRTAFPTRPAADPGVIERGKSIYGVQCAFCHGSDARGGEGGPNLLRSQLVLNDQNGELIAPVVQNGREGMPKFNLTMPQISDVATYIHSFTVGGYDVSRMTPPSIVVGNAKAGEAYFQSACASCHSVTGDLKGIGAKYTDAKQLQQTWLMPGARGGFGAASGPRTNVPPTTVTVTSATGQKITGRLVRIDDFTVTLLEADGGERTFTRDGDVPAVEIHDPLKPHKDLLATYSDKNIHDLTAYLVTVK